MISIDLAPMSLHEISHGSGCNDVVARNLSETNELRYSLPYKASRAQKWLHRKYHGGWATRIQMHVPEPSTTSAPYTPSLPLSMHAYFGVSTHRLGTIMPQDGESWHFNDSVLLPSINAAVHIEENEAFDAVRTICDLFLCFSVLHELFMF